jgi:L-lactate dehydrogenase
LQVAAHIFPKIRNTKQKEAKLQRSAYEKIRTRRFLRHMETVNIRKSAVIGCGFVGSASAFALMQSGLFSEIVLIDTNREKAEGEAMDISHGIPFARHMKVYAGGYDDIVDAAIIIITAGAGQKPGESRLALVHKNVAIYQSIIPEITRRGCSGILLVVSNPVDILTYVTLKLSRFPESRVLGSGTVLDTARLKYSMGELLGVDSKSVHAFIIGEHGDSEIAAFSCANISGIGLDEFCEMRGYRDHVAKCREIAHEVKNLAYEIIEKKQATYYGIAMAVKRICEVIIRDEKSILPVSCLMHGEYGVDHVALSMPAIVGKDGVETHVPLLLDDMEQQELKESAQLLRRILDDCSHIL